MTTSENILDDENAHVQELKRLFFSSNVDENQCLNASGLRILCDKLKLSDFASEIIERVLCGANTVDFYNFKERFVLFLPEIIDVSSGTIDPLMSKAQHTALSLGFGDSQKLNRYETRLLCENTDELEQLSVVDINSLFERADSQRSGRVSVQQFLAQYRLQKRLSAEVHFIADSYVPSVNLFEALDPASTGNVDSHELMELWNKSGLRIDEGLAILKNCGQPMSGQVNLIFLSAYLERELSQAVAEASSPVKAAVFALHHCVDHLRCVNRESEARAEHFHKQLQLANQRRTLLIEELEHNQLSIEQGYDKRLRETEERYRSRLVQMEDKFRIDKQEIQNELEQVEEELARKRQQEVSTKNKILLLERQTTRLNAETREQSETISQLEHLNRQLRVELSKVMQPRPVEDNTQLLMWKQKVDLLVAHNKRLREKIQELSVHQKKKNKGISDGEALSSRWSVPFKSQLALIKKRRSAKGDTLSEMDSEPESIFVRHRRHRLLKKKDRKKRHEKTFNRIVDESDSSSNTNYREQVMVQKMEDQLNKLKEDHRKEIASIRKTASTTMADALTQQEKQLNAQFEKEKRQFENRLSNEKGVIERTFAEEKMKLMNRLQDEFNAELRKIASMVNRPESAATVEQYKRHIKTLESSLEGQKNGYEKRLGDMKEKYKNSLRAQNSSYHIDKNTTNFISLIEQYRSSDNNKTALPTYTTSRSSLGIEKQRPSTNHQPFQRSLSSVTKCDRCETMETRLREIYHVIADDQVESGIEDLGSSAGSQTDDKSVLKKEIRKLKGKLEAAKEKITDLRVLITMTSSPRYKNSLGGSEGGSNNDWRRSRFYTLVRSNGNS